MATLNELYAEVDGHADTLKRIVGEDLGHMVSVTILYKLATTGAGSIRRWIMVKDRSLPTELAYWDGAKPEYLTGADGFPANLKAACDAYRTEHPEFERYEIINSYSTDQYGVVKWYVWDSVAVTSSAKTYVALKSGTVWTWRKLA